MKRKPIKIIEKKKKQIKIIEKQIRKITFFLFLVTPYKIRNVSIFLVQETRNVIKHFDFFKK